MSDSRRPFVRTSLGRLAVTGAATLATVFSLAPVSAMADDAPATTEPAQTAEPVADESAPEAPPKDETEEPAPVEETPEAPVEEPPTAEAPVEEPPAAEKPTAEEPTASEDLTLDTGTDLVAAAEEAALGRQQFRVGVRLAPGSYLQEGTEPLEGSYFDVYIRRDDVTVRYFNCTAGAADPSGVAYCLDGDGAPLVATLEPGETVNIAQRSSPDGTSFSPNGITIETCEATEGETCLEDGTIKTTDAIFTNTGEPPAAVADSITVDHDTETVIDVLGNDTVPADPSTALSIQVTPSHGTAAVFTDRTDGRQKIRYTPTEGYSGRDTLRYTVTNASGSSSAQVTLDVENMAGEIVPDYGTQKLRIGVQVESGAFVPAGTTTAGSVFQITETSATGTVTTTTCTTSSNLTGSADSSCFGNSIFGRTVPAGASVSVVQLTANENLVKDPDTETLPPCDVNDPCGGPLGTSLQFTNDGSVLPDTSPDSATTDEGTSVTIDVLANDDSEDPNTDLEIAAGPGDGRAVVVGSAAPAPEPEPEPELPPFEIELATDATAAAVAGSGTLAVRYTPRAGFTGTDSFQYAVSNSNGSSIETVTVRVRGGVVEGTDTDTDDSGDTASDGAADDTNSVLPDTGGPGFTLLGLGGLLVAAGAAAVGRGRRRSDSSV